MDVALFVSHNSPLKSDVREQDNFNRMDGGMAKKKNKRAGAKKKQVKIYVAIIVAVAVVAAVFVVRGLRTGGRVKVVGNYTLGAADAPVVLEEFSDYG